MDDLSVASPLTRRALVSAITGTLCRTRVWMVKNGGATAKAYASLSPLPQMVAAIAAGRIGAAF